MSIPGNNLPPDVIMKFNEEFEYVNSKLKNIRTKVLSIHPTHCEYVNTTKDNIEGTNVNGLCDIKNEESENKIADLCNVVTKTTNSDSFPTTNLPNVMSNMNMAPTNPTDMFFKFMEYQRRTNSMDKETIKKNFVDASMLMYKAKKTARETDLYLKKLNNHVLPRCRSADITSDIVNSRNIDVPPKITRESQYIFKKQLDKNIKINEKSTKTLKPNLKSNFEESVKNADKIKDSQEINYTSKLTESIKENSMNNIGVVNIDYKDEMSYKEENNKFKNLTVQKIPRVDLKPDLVTQKLANIQIKPVKKKTECDLMPNVAYSNFKFESESQTCSCQPMIQPKPTKNNKVARNEICKILYEMLENKSSNDLLSDELNNQLQTILINLEEPNPLTNNYFSQLENLVEQHSKVDLNENIIKNRLLEIAKNVFENKNEGLSFDQVSIEIERNSQQLLQRLAKIENFILTSINPSTRFSNDDNQQDCDVVNKVDRNHLIQHPNNNFNSKNFQGNKFKSTNKFVSVREYLNQGSKNSVCSKKIENVPAVKKSASKVILCSKDSTILNPSASSIINTQNTLNDNNITQPLKKYLSKSNNEDLSQATESKEHENDDEMSKQSTQGIESDGENSTMDSFDIIFCKKK